MPDFPNQAVSQAHIEDLELIARGKVRDIFAVSDTELAIVATDRLSAYDVVLPDAIPGKGAILSAVAQFWFELSAKLIKNHLTGKSLADVSGDAAAINQLSTRTMIVKRLQPLPIEAVVRGYIIGSGWHDYQKNGAISGQRLPSGLQKAEQLAEPLFTPATKAAVGDHDENIDFDQVCALIGADRATEVRDVSLRLYDLACEHASARGLIVADTKFEFGLDAAGDLHLIDEVLTPDSSRFWDQGSYQVGISPASFDKQIVRDSLETLGWNKTAPGPVLASAIIKKTRQRYIDVYRRLTGPRL